VRGAEVGQEEVGTLADLERADRGLEPQGRRPVERRHSTARSAVSARASMAATLGSSAANFSASTMLWLLLDAGPSLRGRP
jgi:hypothetical protein